jgi:predicted dehydrogenase
MKANNEPIRVGLIGCGQAGAHSHLPALRYVPEVEVVALADLDQDCLQQVADRFHVKRRYPDLSSQPILEGLPS